jgi:ectoine hydroxylase-related dioxygenase (phytanoyl-CoA dioxygenase family)
MNKQIEEIGYMILDNVIDDELFGKLINLSDCYINRTLKRQNHTGNVGQLLFRTENLLTDFPLPELINNETVYKELYSIFEGDFELRELYIYFSKPNNGIQELHRDSQTLFKEFDHQIPPYIIVVQYPLVDFNFNSGGTRIIPKSHRSQEDPHRIEFENLELIRNYTPVINKKGCIIRDSRVWHGAGVNLTNEIRAMYTLSFTRKFIGSPTQVSKDLYFCLDRDKRHLLNHAI